MEITMSSCSERLYEWFLENDLREDPKRISKLDEEARRRWGHEMSSLRIGKIVEGTLRAPPRRAERERR